MASHGDADAGEVWIHQRMHVILELQVFLTSFFVFVVLHDLVSNEMHWGLCPVCDNNELLCMVILGIRQILSIVVNITGLLGVVSVQSDDLLVVLSACFVGSISKLNLSVLFTSCEDLAELVDHISILFEFVGIKSFKISDKRNQLLW